ncbi:MAG: YebC/PmpR family DNA-binding transcriptional regulator, partial [Dehalococcoidia bacterium]|nr:YebC/PmpR family DNA-binding transcriptional regulator [Dehalococcoidia bacterium]
GCVAWLFEPQGVISARAEGQEPDDLALIAIEVGAEDVQISDGVLEITADPKNLEELRRALEASKAHIISSEDLMQPKTSVALDEKGALQSLRLLDRLESLDDVQRVFFNADIPDEVMEKFEG